MVRRGFWSFGFWLFDIVLSFEFRASDLQGQRGETAAPLWDDISKPGPLGPDSLLAYRHESLQAARRCTQLSVQVSERMDSRPPIQQLFVHHAFSRSHRVPQSVARGGKVEQLKVRTLSKTTKTINPHRFLFNYSSFHRSLMEALSAVPGEVSNRS